MIIKELSKFIILDEIRTNANSAEVYFLSHLLGNEMLSIPENWPSRIYTSEFIFDVLSKKRPEVHLQYFRILQANVPIKLKSKDKTIMVTMFETGEITNNVMFFFDDNIATYLYTGVFTEIGALYKNEQFMQYVQKGIDNVYVDTTRCKGRSYIFTEDTVDEIKQISVSHPDSKIAVIIPTYGYEKLLVHLAKEFPQDIYAMKNQRKILSKLGYKDLLAKSSNSRIIILSPGITPDFIETNKIVTVYINEGKTPATTSACGMYLRQWSPLPSLMDLQSLLDIIRPKNIIPIKKVPLEENIALPECLKWFTDKRRTGEDDARSSTACSDSHGSETDNESICSISSCSTARGSTSEFGSSLATTRVFVHPTRRSKEAKSHSAKEPNESPENAVAQIVKEEDTESQEKVSPPKRMKPSCDLTTKRTRIIRHHNNFDFESDEDE